MTEGSDHHLLFEETPGGAEELKAEVKHDYSSSHDGIVPLSVRRGTWTHHVPLWVTLYAGFSYMALGSSSTPTATGSVSC